MLSVCVVGDWKSGRLQEGHEHGVGQVLVHEQEEVRTDGAPLHGSVQGHVRGAAHRERPHRRRGFDPRRASPEGGCGRVGVGVCLLALFAAIAADVGAMEQDKE